MTMQELFDTLEPAAGEMAASLHARGALGDLALPAALSQAASLKRIADVLENVTNYAYDAPAIRTVRQ